MTRIKKRYQALKAIHADDAAWQLDQSVDWQARFDSEPKATFQALRALYRNRSAEREELEDLYWQGVLHEGGGSGEWAGAVLDRLRLAPGHEGPLLDLGEKGRRRLEAHLLAAVAREPAFTDLVEFREPLSSPDRLNLAAAFQERRGEIPQAVSGYALAHDAALPTEALDPARRVLLRFHVARVLHRHGLEEDPKVAQCVRFVSDLLRHARRVQGHRAVSSRSYDDLVFSLQSWLGERFEESGDWREAARAFSEATVATADGDRPTIVARWATALDHLGEAQQAFEHLNLSSANLKEKGDGVDSDLWHSVYSQLHRRLGGDLDRRATLEVWLDLGEVQDRLGGRGELLRGDDLARWQKRLEEEVTREAGKTRLHRLEERLFLAFLHYAQGQIAAAEDRLREMTALAAKVENERLELARRTLSACCRLRAGATTEAAMLFETLRPAARRLFNPDRLLPFLSYHLEALAVGDGSKATSRVTELVGQFAINFERLLRSQPGGGARRSARRNHQRSIERALLALFYMAEQVGSDSPTGQLRLEQIWSLLDACRNPELQWQPQRPTDRWLEERQKELEDQFHRALRTGLTLSRAEGGPGWREALDDLLLFEMTSLTDSRRPAPRQPDPPMDGVAVAFFFVTESAKEPQLLVLARQQDRFGSMLLPLEQNQLGHRLRSFGDQYLSNPAGEEDQLRDVYGPRNRHPALPVPDPAEQEAPSLRELLPEAVRQRLRRPQTDVGLEPWYLFPDDLLYSLPIEMLPEEPGGQRFGQERPVQLCLRSSPSPVVGRPPKLRERGWLGVGLDDARGYPRLRKACEEIRTIKTLLEREQVRRAELLMERHAHAGNLEARLAVLQPAVLHCAVHGTYDAMYPDACALILASAHRESLAEPLAFRRIRRLPLDGVDLVVLSACSSLRGRSDRGSGMEGLAWAFLEAGAGQVIASRYAVDDRAAPQFMEVLYKHLLTQPAALALGYARAECLDAKMAPQQVGAWSIWA